MAYIKYPDGTNKPFDWENEDDKRVFWHSSSHLMAQALEALYPGVKFGIGPAIENGFYYDVMPAEGQVIKDSDFEAIEKMKKERKTTTTIGLADGLKRLGKNVHSIHKERETTEKINNYKDIH